MSCKNRNHLYKSRSRENDFSSKFRCRRAAGNEFHGCVTCHGQLCMRAMTKPTNSYSSLFAFSDLKLSIGSVRLSDSRMRTRMSTRFDCPFLAKILEKIITRTINLSLIEQYRLLSYSIAGNWAVSLIERCQNCYRVLDFFWHDIIFAKPRTKMTTISRFSRQNDAVLRTLSVVLWENLVLVVVRVLESKALYHHHLKSLLDTVCR